MANATRKLEKSFAVKCGLIIAAVIVITPASLGIHELMLEGLHVAYPKPVGLPIWARYLNFLLIVLALIAFCRLAQPRLARVPTMVRCLAVSLVYLMLHETFRLVIIDSVLSNAWIFHAIQVLPKLLYAFILCSVVVFATPKTSSIWVALGVAVSISATGMFIVEPIIGWAFVPVLKAVAFLDFPQIYNEPFRGHVLVVIYATFVEAVMATFAIAALAWERLSPSTPLRLIQFVSLVLLMKGSVLRVFLDSFWIRSPWPDALLSEAQFGLEALAMALLTGVAWTMLQGRGGSTTGNRRL